jgi:hypothetical protein
MPQAAPPKKGMSGCLIAFLVVGGLFLVSMIGGGIWFYSEFGGFVGATGDMAKLMVDAQNAPGTKEMKKAGCTEAFALDMKKMAKTIQRFEDEMAKREKRKPKPVDLGKEGVGSHMLICKKTLGEAPTCEKVAKAFIDEVKPDSEITVTVESSGSNKCTERFDTNGKNLGKGEAVDLPTQ